MSNFNLKTCAKYDLINDQQNFLFVKEKNIQIKSDGKYIKSRNAFKYKTTPFSFGEPTIYFSTIYVDADIAPRMFAGDLMCAVVQLRYPENNKLAAFYAEVLMDKNCNLWPNKKTLGEDWMQVYRDMTVQMTELLWRTSPIHTA